MARTSVHAKLLAAMDAAPEEEKEEDVPMAELLRRERAEAAAAVQAQADLARREAERAQKMDNELQYCVADAENAAEGGPGMSALSCMRDV